MCTLLVNSRRSIKEKISILVFTFLHERVCVLRMKDGTLVIPGVKVHLGVVTREGGGEVVIEASKVIPHPKLNFLYDVALIKCVPSPFLIVLP